MATAHQILLAAIEEVLGPGSDVARYLSRAISSDDPLDLLLAQAAFEDLDPGQKKTIQLKVDSAAETEISRRRGQR